MFNTKHRSGSNRWILGIVLLLVAVTVAAGVACGDGVSEEEFSGLQKELETEKTLSQFLKSELVAQQANVERLGEAVGTVEVQVVGLESELARERATAVANQDRIDQAEAETALLAAFLAWNRKDQETFAASFIDIGSVATVLPIPESLGEPSLALRHVRDATVSGDTVTIQAMFALGTHRNSVRYSMAKQEGVWKIAGEERLSPKIKGYPTVVEVRLDGCTSSSESETVVEGSVAFKVDIANAGHQHLILKTVPEDLELGRLLQGDTEASETVVDVAFIGETMMGESINVAFTEALKPGRYALFCYAHGTKDAEGIVATLTVR